ncbi:MAG: hypothetical protein U9Q77_07155 [Candidatus Marinimicrobia bacterium]|nr:hypothetical protein [Candidatus Neomarinimicrobiota bacterium]
MNFKYFSILILAFCLFYSCETDPDGFQVKADRVLEGKFTALAFSPTQLESNYPMETDQTLSQPIIFKLSLNGRDNEAGFGQDHQLIVPRGISEFYAPTLSFGIHAPVIPGDPPPLEHAANVHFRVDLRPVLTAFTNSGFYITPTNDTIYANSFEGLYLAGGTAPMTWIWDDPNGLDHLRFDDSELDSIYKLSLRFEPPDTDTGSRTWALTEDISELPHFSSPQAPLLEALTNLALEETILNIRSDSAFSAGKKWRGVWTRDISYSAMLSLAYLFPENVKASLRAKLSPNKRIIQDTGTGGSWPISSDRHLWTLAAWEVFLASGDHAWLDEIREPIINALKEDLLWNRDPVSGMLLGETSFEDWREQTYSEWMSPADIHASQALSTNVIFKRALEIGLALANNNSDGARSWPELVTRLDHNILRHFWNESLGAPSSYVISSPAWLPAAHRDLLGESLGILFCNSFAQVAAQLVSTYPRSQYGSPVISHQLPHSPPYHNKAIWPFVEAYALLAAKQVENQEAYHHSFNGLIRSAALFLTHRENFEYASGRPDQTEINSDRQLWSDAAWLGAIYKGLFGLSVNYDFGLKEFELVLAPNNPFQWDHFSITNLALHDTPLSIILKGSGSSISAISVNGTQQHPGKPIPLRGEPLDIMIELKQNRDTSPSKIERVEHLLPKIPKTSWSADTLIWWSETGVSLLEVNGQILDTLTSSPTSLPDSLMGFYTLRAMDSTTTLSLPGQPYYRGPSAMVLLAPEQPYYVELGQDIAFIKMDFSVPSGGNYLLRFFYSNGSGSISTGNTCSLAKLTINEWWLEQMVSFPHTGSWDSWEESAWLKAQFQAGQNTLILNQETLPVQNMNGKLNQFRLKSMEIVPVFN